MGESRSCLTSCYFECRILHDSLDWQADMNMGFCKQCAAPAEAGLIFCKNCGATLRPPVPLTQSREQKTVSDVPLVAPLWVSKRSLVFGRQNIGTIGATTYTYVCVNPKCPLVTEPQEHNFSPPERTARGEVGPVICSCCGRPVQFVPDAQHVWPSIAVGLLSAVIAGGVVDAIAGRGAGIITGMSVGGAVGASVQKILVRRAGTKALRITDGIMNGDSGPK